MQLLGMDVQAFEQECLVSVKAAAAAAGPPTILHLQDTYSPDNMHLFCAALLGKAMAGIVVGVVGGVAVVSAGVWFGCLGMLARRWRQLRLGESYEPVFTVGTTGY